jgi:hypothetical protein
VVGDTGPVVRFTEKGTDLPEGHIPKYAPHKNLFIWLGHGVEDLPDVTDAFTGAYLLIKGDVLRWNILQISIGDAKLFLMLFHVGIICVFGDLAQPDAHFTVPTETAYGIYCLVKCLTGDLLGNMFAAGQVQGEKIDGLEISVINFLELHCTDASFLEIRLPNEKNLTKIFRKSKNYFSILRNISNYIISPDWLIA